MSAGWLSVYSHEGRIAVLVELSTLNTGIHMDVNFVALGRDLAIHIAASEPADIKELLTQPFVKNPDQSIQSLLAEKSTAMHDSISVSRFIRWDTHCGDEEPDPVHDPAMAVGLNHG